MANNLFSQAEVNAIRSIFLKNVSYHEQLAPSIYFTVDILKGVLENSTLTRSTVKEGIPIDCFATIEYKIDSVLYTTIVPLSYRISGSVVSIPVQKVPIKTITGSSATPPNILVSVKYIK